MTMKTYSKNLESSSSKKKAAAPASISATIGSVRLHSCLMAASGTWAYGLEFLNHPLNSCLGAFVTKSLSVKPSEGNPMPRIYETEAGMLNSIGLQNMGIDAFLEKVEPKLRSSQIPYVLSVYANHIKDFEILAEKVLGASALAVELNISCPNIEKGGLEFSSEAKTTEALVKNVRKLLKKKPLWVKLSPNVTSIVDIALAAEAGGADALSMINTLVGMAINVESQKPWLGRITGGLSGPAIRPIAVEKIFRCYKHIKIPIVGMGGIRNARDVLEFFMAGASAVQIGTWNFRDPYAYTRMAEELDQWMASKNIKNIQELTGRAHKT